MVYQFQEPQSGLLARAPDAGIIRPRREPGVELLTRRERQVLYLMADGLSTKQVAGLLRVSFKTAASHRSRILAKLGVHETISAVRWAIRAGIVDP